MKIRTKFLLTIVSLTVIIGATVVSGILSATKIVEHQIRDKYTAVSVYTMDKIHRLFSARLNDMALLSNEPVVRSRTATPEQLMGKLIEYKKHFISYAPYESISFYGLRGIRIAGTDRRKPGMKDPFSEYWRIIERGESSVLGISESESVEERFFYIARAVKDDRNVAFGVVVARIPVEELLTIVEHPLRMFRGGGSFDVDLLDRNGLLLYSSYNKGGTLKETLAEWTLLKEQVSAGIKAGELKLKKSGKDADKIMLFSSEEADSYFRGNGWILVLSVPKKIAMASITGLRNRMIAMLAAIGAVALVVAFILSRTITRPIVKLRNAVTNVGKGMLDVRLEAGSRDEIGQLTVLFNNMVARLETLHNELTVAAATDSLTGIFNRNKIEQILDAEMERARRYHNPLSVVLFDLDHFKTINDTYGHQAGDYVLQTAIRAIREKVRGTDFLGRWGGEEFLLIAAETSLRSAVDAAEKIREHVEAFPFVKVGSVTISCGVAEFRQGDDVDQMIRKADEALYRAKRKGRNRVEVERGRLREEQILLFKE